MSLITTTEMAAIVIAKLLSCIEAFLLLNFYSEPRKSRKQSFLVAFIFFPIVTFKLYSSIMMERGATGYYPLIFIITSILTALWPVFYSCFFKRNKFETQFLAYFTNSFNPLLYIVAISLKHFIDTNLIIKYSISHVLLECISRIIAILIFIPFVKKLISVRMKNIPRPLIYALVFLIPISQIAPILTNGPLGELFNSKLYYVVAFSLLVAGIFCFVLFYRYAQNNEKLKKMELKLKFEQDKTNYFEALQLQSEKTRKMAHDITNHLRFIQMLSSENKLEDVQIYSQNLLNEYSTNVKVFCSNSFVNSMLLYYDSVAVTNNVKFTANADVTENLQIPPIDLVSIISNILDNAFEACTAVTDNEKTIEITISTKNNAFICNCKNSYSGIVNKKGTKLLTSKKDKINHGLGSEIIKDTTSRYGGTYKFENNNSDFYVVVYIPM